MQWPVQSSYHLKVEDVLKLQNNVRLTPESGHQLSARTCPICAKSRLMQCSKLHRHSIISRVIANASGRMEASGSDAPFVRLCMVPLPGLKLACFHWLRDAHVRPGHAPYFGN